MTIEWDLAVMTNAHADAIKSLVASAKATAKASQERESALAEVARMAEMVADLRAVLAEVLATFTVKTHPGLPCRQSGHIALHTIDRWREALS